MLHQDDNALVDECDKEFENDFFSLTSVSGTTLVVFSFLSA